jgi:hypothetical protein
VTEQPEQTAGRYEVKFEASGVVGKGEGPDALDVPEQNTEENREEGSE